MGLQNDNHGNLTFIYKYDNNTTSLFRDRCNCLMKSSCPEVEGVSCTTCGRPVAHCNYLQLVTKCEKTQCNHWETTYSIRRRMSSSVYSFEWAITVACSVLLPSPLAESLFGILYYVWVSWNLLWWRLSPKGTSAVGRLTWTSQSKTSLSLSTMYLFQCLSI